MEEKKQKEKNASRREVLKKAKSTAVFVLPTVLTFKVADLAVAASSGRQPTTPQKW